MAAAKKKASVKKLKKQVKTLQKKEAKSRDQLKTAVNKMRKLGKAYKNKLASKVRVMKKKLNTSQLATYYNVAANLEQQMTKAIHEKIKAISAAISSIDKSDSPKKSSVKKKKKVKARKAVKKVKAKKSVKKRSK